MTNSNTPSEQVIIGSLDEIRAQIQPTISAGNRIKELLRDVADEMDGGLSVSPMKQVILNQIDFHEVNIRRNEEALASFKGVLAMHPDNVSLKESIATSEASLAAHQGSLDNLKGHLQNA